MSAGARRVTISAKDKGALLTRLVRARIRDLNLAVMRSIIGRINKTEGVAFCFFCEYARESGRSERTVQRTVQTACAHSILGRAYREGAPALWCPSLMDMTSEEAVRRVNLLVYEHKGYSRWASPTLAYELEQGPSDPGEVPASPRTSANSASNLTPIPASKSAPDLTPELALLKPPKKKTSSNGLTPSPAPAPPRWRPVVTGAAHDLAVKVGRAAGLSGETYEWPPHWRLEVPAIVQQWLDAGWQPSLILPIIEATARAKRDGPPNSVRYFEKPICRHLAALEEARDLTPEFTSRPPQIRENGR